MNRFNPSDIATLAPLFIFVLGGLLMVLAESFTKGRDRSFMMKMTVATSIIAGVAAVFLWKKASGETAFGGMLIGDKLSYFASALFAGAVAITAVSASAHQREYGWENGEFFGLLLFAAAGMTMLAMAGDLVTVFIGIESMSLAAYVLIALRRQGSKGAEGAIKYFLMGAFATGFLLYGIALIYGAAGTTNIAAITTAIANKPNEPLMILGALFMVVAFGFKVAAVPFHMWAPDAYEGAPSPVTGFMASAVKAAAFVGMIRVFAGAFGGDVMPLGQTGWTELLAVLAAITMTVGNIGALKQENIKRMLAYSSVSHAGLLLVGIVSMGYAPEGTGQVAVLYYLVAYSVTTLGAFGIVSWIGGREHERVNVDDWAGLATKYPAAALAMTICLLSLGGMPPTGGFFAKFYVLKAGMEAADQSLLWLVAIGAINSVVSIYYYLRLVMAMYFRQPVGEFRPAKGGGIVFSVALCAGLVLLMGLMPGWWLEIAGS